MPPAKNQKIWNDDLISACEARRAQASAMGSSHEFQWINAKSKIEGTAKNIYITSTDSIKNLPDGLSKTVVHYLERVIRGQLDATTPQGSGRGSGSSGGTSRGGGGGGSGLVSSDEPPLLRTMKYREGSYAILRVFHDHGGAVLTKAQIIRAAQPYCNVAMELNYHAAGGRAAMMKQGWASISTLEKHRLVDRDQGALDFTAHRVYKTSVDQWALTDAGRAFIPLMLAKFAGGGGGSGSGSGSGSFAGGGGGGGSRWNEDDAEDGARDDAVSRSRYRQPPGPIPPDRRVPGAGPDPGHDSDRDTSTHPPYTPAVAGTKRPAGSTAGPLPPSKRSAHSVGGTVLGVVSGASSYALGSGGGSASCAAESDPRAMARLAAERRARVNEPPPPPRPSFQQPSFAATGSLLAAAATATAAAVSLGRWTCAVCTFADNVSLMAVCEMCDTPAPPATQPAAPPAAASSAARKAPMAASAGMMKTLVELSDDTDEEEESQLLAAAKAASLRAHVGGASVEEITTSSEITLLVDERERTMNANPLSIFLRVHKELENTEQRWRAERHQLALGDFAWIRGGGGGGRAGADDAPPSGVPANARMLDLLIERKTIGDLVGRSAKGHHLEQLRRMQRAPLSRYVLLLEGDLYRASAHTAYDAPERTERGVRERDVVQTAEDTLALLAG
jgi:uncharacterized membrane protein YgcG